MKRKKVSVIISAISVLQIIIFFLINKFIYQNSLRNISFILLIQLLVLFIVHNNLSTITPKHYSGYFIVNILLLIIIPITVILAIPKYTYNEAKTKFTNEKVTNSVKFINVDNSNNIKYTDIPLMKTIDLSKSPYILVNKYYLFFIDNNGSIEGYVFNSVNGTYRPLNVQNTSN